MSIELFTFIVWLVSLFAGLLGSLTGLGGGVVIVPVLTLFFHVDVRYAIGASLMSVIATSCAAAGTFLKSGYSNVRIGVFLEVATTLGALVGAAIATRVPTGVVSVIFGLVLLFSAYRSFSARPMRVLGPRRSRFSTVLRLDSSFTDQGQLTAYQVRRVPLGFSLMFLAGGLSGLLGIGSGAVKVLAMDQAMRIPFKVSSATSNFMIGVTAGASAGVYLNRGYIDPGLCIPVVLGVLPAAVLGATLIKRLKSRPLQVSFAVVIAVLAVQMVVNGVREL
ncbi:sulfite exporter TauE/SafE family protein [Deinococcus rubellus]|uniref:sulfite exporter TauE/SafE family protein n=1 Tax=Deinococcus rubellus TaxID=1889240 RepID=UPI0031E5E676